MPLIVLTGIPSSGKSELAKRLETFFTKDHDKVVKIIRENELIPPGQVNRIFSDPGQEKTLRGTLKSEVVRLLHKDQVLILDGLNYIKGFRYELYCASKSSKTTQCTVHCDVSPEDAWAWNIQRSDEENRYDKELFDALCMRYEAPIGHNRWDAPLLLNLKELPLTLSHAYDALFLRKAPPPNQSTQNKPLSATNFLHDLDRVTKEIIQSILEAQKSGIYSQGDSVKVPGTEERFVLSKSVFSMSELTRVKRQFITYAKSRSIEDVSRLATMFVQYLNTTLVE